MRVLGVDPGCRQSGIVLCDGDHVIAHEVLERFDRAPLPGVDYLMLVVGKVRAYPHDWLAVEGVTAPTGFAGGERHPISLDGVLGAAMVLGAVVAAAPAGVAVVPPGGHGSLPLSAYPAVLVGARERSGTGRLRHCRSALDVIVHARRLQLLRRAS